MEAIVEREENLRLSKLAIPRRITAALSAVRALVGPFKDQFAWAASAWAEQAALCDRRKRVADGSLAALESCLNAALSLLEDVENKLVDTSCEPNSGLETSTRADADVQRIYNDSITESVCTGSAEGSSRDRSAPTITKRRIAVPPEAFQDTNISDPFGITRSGFKWTEASHLFPFHAGMIEIDRGPVTGTVEVLARLIGVSNATAALAEHRLGPEAAAICLLMTGQQYADGMILKTPEAYLRGIIRKAAKGELNIGHSLFGRRQGLGTDSTTRPLV